jgi:hypothetical protein
MVCALLQVLHIEEGVLPLLARLFSLYAREVRGLAHIEGDGAAYHWDGFRRLGLEVDCDDLKFDNKFEVPVM